MPRKCPVLLRRGPVSGRIHALRRYTLKDDILTAQDKDDVTSDFYHLMMEDLFGKPEDCPDIISILDGVADGYVLRGEEAAQVRVFRDRFAALVTAHNERLESARTG